MPACMRLRRSPTSTSMRRYRPNCCGVGSTMSCRRISTSSGSNRCATNSMRATTRSRGATSTTSPAAGRRSPNRSSGGSRTISMSSGCAPRPPDSSGLHDFQSFTDDDPHEKSTQVLVELMEIHEDGDLMLIHVEGSHFLWKMVRRLVGVLVEIGRGGLSETDAACDVERAVRAAGAAHRSGIRPISRTRLLRRRRSGHAGSVACRHRARVNLTATYHRDIALPL